MIENGVICYLLYWMKELVNMIFVVGEYIVVVGRNGVGKSILVDMIIGWWLLLMNEVKYDFFFFFLKMVYENIKYIVFCDLYGDFDGNYYY